VSLAAKGVSDTKMPLGGNSSEMANTAGSLLSQREHCQGTDWPNEAPGPRSGATFSVSPHRAAHLVNCAFIRRSAGKRKRGGAELAVVAGAGRNVLSE
jgi:hypothetical protein